MFSTPLTAICKKEKEGSFTTGGGKYFFFSRKDQIVNILGLGRHMASLAAPQCYSWSAKAATGWK